MLKWLVSITIFLTLSGCFESKYKFVNADRFLSDSRIELILAYLTKSHISSYSINSNLSYNLKSKSGRFTAGFAEIDKSTILMQINPPDTADLYSYWLFRIKDENVAPIAPRGKEAKRKMSLLAENYGLTILIVEEGNGFSIRILNDAEPTKLFEFLRIYSRSDASFLFGLEDPS